MGGSCRMAGGGVSVQADLIDMRRTSNTLDGSGDEATHLGLSVGRVAGHLPAKSAVLSPGSAADVARRVLALTLGPASLGALALRMEVVARGMRVGATAYQRADEINRGVLAAISVVAAPIHVASAAVGAAEDAVPLAAAMTIADPESGTFWSHWGRAFATDIGHQETVDPHLTGDAITVVRELFWLGDRNTLGFEDQVGLLLGLGRAGGRFVDDPPLTVTAVHEVPPPTRGAQDLGDLVAQEGDVESSAHSNDDHTTVRVHHVVHDDGSAAWVVDIPGTQNWRVDGPHNPMDGTGNITTMAGVPAAIYPAVRSAMRQAMTRAGVQPGDEPVMLVGHSQGGIAATRMAQSRSFRSQFNVSRVVTVAAPVTRMKVPKGVKALEIEHTGDLVPGLDAQYAPTQANAGQVTCDPPEASDNPLDQHHAGGYVTTVRGHLGRDTDVPMVRRFYDDSDVFFGGSDTAYDFTVRRP